MKTKHLIQIAKGCERLSVTEKDGVTYIAETKRGGVGIVICGDTIQRTDVPSKGMRVYEAERLLGLQPKASDLEPSSKSNPHNAWITYRRNRRNFQS